MLDRLDASKKLYSFDLFDTLIRVKGHENIHNSALALRAMVKLANDHLDVLESLEQEQDDGGQGSTTEGH